MELFAKIANGIWGLNVNKQFLSRIQLGVGETKVQVFLRRFDVQKDN